MTTSIDQAFRKAYAKRTGTSGATSESTNGTIAVWIDEPSGKTFRNESAQAVGAPHFEPGPANPKVAVDAPAAPSVADESLEPTIDLPTATVESAVAEPSEPIAVAPTAAPAEPAVVSEPVVVAAEPTSPPPAVVAPTLPESSAVAPIAEASKLKIDVRPGTTAYDAWAAKLQTLDLAPKMEASKAMEPTIAKPSPALTRDALPAFAPVWEVDEFLLPEVAKNLVAEHLHAMGTQLERASREGLQTMAVSSQNRQTGRSTVAIAIAQVAANNGLRVALVDADAESPSLLEKLQLEMTNDWVDAISQDVSIEEVAVTSLANNFCFLPLLEKTPEQLKQIDHCAASLLERLKLHFDFIVVDFGPLQHASFGLSIPLSDELFDAVVLIEDMRRIDPETLESYARRIRAVGIDNIGLIENYVDADTADAAA
ncbi:CobQ/CobB/MinD/ParA nucleotide binding domain protein [Rosistilla carotiformis]|uniref:CobQ/CobB/MinD/ParA nucleotide binding domain protein n=1 Tax=Rosistilla carotiformis TaxID=2528017 RepID=A0A518JQQ3_9BACT|nr:AAA family ATPase [Rosistilla carotiformis]QDV67871.1 CobQ/CobB/MinD/ParA nucleotide binding domain protein [Rosistilla carotiformis]